MNDDNKTVRAMDILFPGIGEIVGGSQREERLEVLKSRMNELKIDEKELQWYLDLRKYGTVKHSGFGLGLERLLLFATGMTNIRDVIPFPKTQRGQCLLTQAPGYVSKQQLDEIGLTLKKINQW